MGFSGGFCGRDVCEAASGLPACPAVCCGGDKGGAALPAAADLTFALPAGDGFFCDGGRTAPAGASAEAELAALPGVFAPACPPAGPALPDLPDWPLLRINPSSLSVDVPLPPAIFCSLACRMARFSIRGARIVSSLFPCGAPASLYAAIIRPDLNIFHFNTVSG